MSNNYPTKTEAKKSLKNIFDNHLLTLLLIYPILATGIVCLYHLLKIITHQHFLYYSLTTLIIALVIIIIAAVDLSKTLIHHQKQGAKLALKLQENISLDDLENHK